MRVTTDFHEFFAKTKMVRCPDRLRAFGLEPEALTGSFWPDEVEELLEVCEADPAFHVVTCVGEGIYVNHYKASGDLFFLAEGENDPAYMLNAKHEFPDLIHDVLEKIGFKRK